MKSTPLDDCYFNWAKGMWETHAWHWVICQPVWVIIGFPLATELTRGVQP